MGASQGPRAARCRRERRRSRFGGVEHHHLILVDTERNDTKILEVVVEFDKAEGLFVGQRVVGYVTKAGHMTKGH